MGRSSKVLRLAGRAQLPDGTALADAVSAGGAKLDDAMHVPKKEFTNKNICRIFKQQIKGLQNLERELDTGKVVPSNARNPRPSSRQRVFHMAAQESSSEVTDTAVGSQCTAFVPLQQAAIHAPAPARLLRAAPAPETFLAASIRELAGTPPPAYAAYFLLGLNEAVRQGIWIGLIGIVVITGIYLLPVLAHPRLLVRFIVSLLALVPRYLTWATFEVASELWRQLVEEETSQTEIFWDDVNWGWRAMFGASAGVAATIHDGHLVPAAAPPPPRPPAQAAKPRRWPLWALGALMSGWAGRSGFNKLSVQPCSIS